MTAPMLTKPCTQNHVVMPVATQPAVGVGRLGGGAHAEVARAPEEHHDDEGAEQPELLADDGEDEVGVGLGQVAPLLGALAEPDAEPAARCRATPATGCSGSRWSRVGPRIEEGEEPGPPVGREQRGEAAPSRSADQGAADRCGGPGTPAAKSTAKTVAPSTRVVPRLGWASAGTATMPNHTSGRAAAPCGRRRPRPGGGRRGRPPANSVHQLGELRRLQLQKPEVDPPRRAVDVDADARHEHGERGAPTTAR